MKGLLPIDVPARRQLSVSNEGADKLPRRTLIEAGLPLGSMLIAALVVLAPPFSSLPALLVYILEAGAIALILATVIVVVRHAEAVALAVPHVFAEGIKGPMAATGIDGVHDVCEIRVAIPHRRMQPNLAATTRFGFSPCALAKSNAMPICTTTALRFRTSLPPA